MGIQRTQLSKNILSFAKYELFIFVCLNVFKYAKVTHKIAVASGDVLGLYDATTRAIKLF